jgi:acetate kinase
VVFDTSHHATIPEYAQTYALPRALATRLGTRKYGFHGTSHHFVAAEAAALLGKPLSGLNAVSCHLGSGGASLCAIVGGRSVDNTMGFSPLQGLMMSTRSGDLDPALTLSLLAAHAGDHEAVNRQLNKTSGVLGMSGFSADIRDVIERAGTAEPLQSPHSLTLAVYTWRIRKYLGAYLAVVGETDTILFTDSIGEAVPHVRWAVCSGMDVFGVKIDAVRNAQCRELPADVAADDSRVRILAIATNEELAIARHTYRLTRQAA